MGISLTDETYEQYVRWLQAQGKKPLYAGYRNDKADIIALLNQGAQKGNLVLVLGAGASVPSGLPSWDQVTKELISVILPDAKSRDLAARLRHLTIPDYRLTRIVESLDPAFRLTVRDALYGKRLRRNKTLEAVTAFVQRCQRKRKRLRIITYNFDDLLERHLDKAGLKKRYLVIDSKDSYYRFRTANPSLAIFHPHGFIPFNGDLERLLGTMLVFSERQYHRSYFDRSHWTSVVQRELFSSCSCLFVGCSFNDQDQRRLLDQTSSAASPCLAAIMRRSNRFKRHRANELTDFIIQHDLSLLNVRAIWVKAWGSIPTILDQLLS